MRDVVGGEGCSIVDRKSRRVSRPRNRDKGSDLEVALSRKQSWHGD